MHFNAAISLAALLYFGELLASNAGEPDRIASFVSAQELADAVAKTESGIGFEVSRDGANKVLMIQRTITGDAEVHMEAADTIVIQKGRGKFLVGGSITGNHETKPGEWRGGSIQGGRLYDVSAGDLILIPPRTPHQAIVTHGTFTYLTIKTPATKPDAPAAARARGDDAVAVTDQLVAWIPSVLQ